MAIVIATIASILLFGAFIIIGAWLGFLAGSLLFTLTITLIVMGASAFISAIIALIFRICGGAYGQ